MPEPVKPEYSDRIGEITQSHYKFLNEKLWGANGAAVRAQFLAADQEQLKTLLRENGIPFDLQNVRILVVDLENGKTNGFDQALAQDFYTLVLPPRPRRHSTEVHYKEMQTWSAAYYHAINDSYGM